ncbi:phosphoacetylglucosamine mutase [Cantharellus anzutake]|uniref:phosphoacetylglucosamine mutase n=1 Tax=Cantharellus anzutake TaxID=1750568 RepID=UPI001907A6A9|nr:phosphoacetylglucosamine mutase [Cantharellus anzutake]KAF8343168.1 phosphoacetylglucosamine mutase [Cantharellus anzutake]
MAQISFPSQLKRLTERHPKPANYRFSYGTAGFRTNGSLLDSVLFRVGVLAGLRSKRLEGKTVGIMITASHNPEEDNGVKIVDPYGEMLEADWEIYATALANAPNTEMFIGFLDTIVCDQKIDLFQASKVVYARDTRPSGLLLVNALRDGLDAIGAIGRDEGICTTPILHYIVRCINTAGTRENYGEASAEGYYKKLSDAYRVLVEHQPTPPKLVVDCANGVGALALQQLAQHLFPILEFSSVNTDTENSSLLNHDCGADYVKTRQIWAPNVGNLIADGERGCALDGDADRLVYFYRDRGHFRLLDGDKIAALASIFITQLIEQSGLDTEKIYVGVVQTAYANGSSTKFYETRKLALECVPTGVKHLHHVAERFPIGIYFEANGHGTVLFSQPVLDAIYEREPISPTQAAALRYLKALANMINQAVGDALSDMLMVEAILAHMKFGPVEWDSLYLELPNRLVKIIVPDRSIFRTEDAERRLVSPSELQERMDDITFQYPQGRAFVRPSGTEDCVRLYAESTHRYQTDEMAYRLAGLIYDEVGGDPATRPPEFL